ncbi:hypothetical protein AAIA71_11500 [Vibrio harveyi]|uniref:hypothetical protein n=1 Tax=Vibrio harveyi TaxID=669 RepID=UPI0031BA9E19
MQANISIRDGFFKKDCEFTYHSGQVCDMDISKSTSVNYNKSTKEFDVENNYLSEISIVDFETNEQMDIAFPFKTNVKNGAFVTVFYVNADKKGWRSAIGLYNHETETGYVAEDRRPYVGFRLLGAGKAKRAFAWILRIVEYIIAFGVSSLGIFLVTKDYGLIQGIFAALLSAITWYPVAFITGLFMPSYFNAKRAFAHFEKEIIKIGEKEKQNSRSIRQKLNEMRNPMNQLKAAGINIGNSAPESTNDGFKSMF